MVVAKVFSLLSFWRYGVLAVLIALVSACSEPVDEEQLIRQQLDEIVAALENKDMDRFLAPISADFSAHQLDRRAVRWLAWRQWQRHDSVAVQLAAVKVKLFEEVSPPRATVTFEALLSGGAWLPQHAGWYSVESGWRKDGDNWRMINAEWERQL